MAMAGKEARLEVVMGSEMEAVGMAVRMAAWTVAATRVAGSREAATVVLGARAEVRLEQPVGVVTAEE